MFFFYIVQEESLLLVQEEQLVLVQKENFLLVQEGLLFVQEQELEGLHLVQEDTLKYFKLPSNSVLNSAGIPIRFIKFN